MTAPARSTSSPPTPTMSSDLLADTGERLRLWTRQEYYQAAELGWFIGQRVELIRGEVYRKMTQNPPHATALYLTARALEARTGPELHVRQQAPLSLLADSDPEPDVLVVRGGALEYVNRHPTSADVLLLIEISDTTLWYDRNKKAGLYAEAGIPEYWILNINDRALEIYRIPSGGAYPAPLVLNEQSAAIPVMLPAIEIRVADLLPPRGQHTSADNA